jgi:hypothetical protein
MKSGTDGWSGLAVRVRVGFALQFTAHGCHTDVRAMSAFICPRWRSKEGDWVLLFDSCGSA